MKTYWSFCLLAFGSSAFAQMHTYHYKQEIKGAEAGSWRAISLPEPVYAKLKSEGNDLRIYAITAEKDTLEVPYILDKKQPKTVDFPLEFRVVNQSQTNEGTFFTLKTPEKQPINEIRLAFQNENFDRKIILEGSNDQKQWFSLLKDYRIVAMKNESVSFAYNTLKFNDSEYSYYRVFIPDPSHEMNFISASVHHKAKTPQSLHRYASQFTVEENKKHKQTWVRVQLPTLLPVSRLHVLPEDTHNYFRPIYIGYEDSIQTPRGWHKRFIQTDYDVLSSQNQNNYDLARQMFTNIVLRIDNQDNQPLAIKEVSVYGAYYQLIARFPQKQATYFLTYGKPNDYQPNYDISRFPESIPTDIASATLGEIRRLATPKNKNTPLTTTNKNWLWGVVTLIVLLLFYFSLKMLREKK